MRFTIVQTSDPDFTQSIQELLVYAGLTDVHLHAITETVSICTHFASAHSWGCNPKFVQSHPKMDRTCSLHVTYAQFTRLHRQLKYSFCITNTPALIVFFLKEMCVMYLFHKTGFTGFNTGCACSAGYDQSGESG